MKRNVYMQNDEELQKELKLKKDKEKISLWKPSVSSEMLKLVGIKDEEYFKKSLDLLCQRWWDKPNTLLFSVGRELVTNTLCSHLAEPIIIAMIADDVEAFNKFYKKEKGDIFCLEFSCLCGSEKIVKNIFLKDDEKIKCLLLSKDAIGYALSSGNVQLTYLLVDESKKLGKTDPGAVCLYSFGNFKDAIEIEDKFPSQNGKPDSTTSPRSSHTK